MSHQTRPLGNSGIEVSAIGLGCMGLSEFYGPPTAEKEAINLLHQAVERGITHFDTAEIYGMGRNEELVGRAFAGRAGEITLATKFGPQRDPESGVFTGVDGSPESVRRSIDGSLRRLGFESIDLYYLHRVDPGTPIEETVGEMARLVSEGKVRALGLSEASADTLRRAHSVHPIAALQTEYSLFTRDIESAILPLCLELGVTLVAYSPLGRGLLTGRYASPSDRPQSDGDYRASMLPRFEEANFAANLALVDMVKRIAARHQVTPAQIALAWVLDHGENVMTIPGTTKLRHLEANLGALRLTLSDDDRAELDRLGSQVRGERYNEMGMAMINQ
jgi:aryl-alcohol dehydrogenase-like predicted oxidoreductase